MIHLVCDIVGHDDHPLCAVIVDKANTMKVTTNEDEVTCPRCKSLNDY